MIVIACLGFLIFEPVDGPICNWKGYWERFKLRWKPFLWYWGGGILSVLLICFRNWWLGGWFFPTVKNHPNLRLDLSSPFPESFYIILTGKEWPAFPGVLGFVVTFGVFVSLLALFWRPKVLANFPLSLSIATMGLFAPYIFADNWGYPPRFTIHLLPLALLSLGIFLNNRFDGFKLRGPP